MSNVTIASIQLTNWRGPTSGVELRLALDKPITTPEGNCYGANPLVVLRAACTITPITVNGIVQYVCTIPAITLPATGNAIVGNTAKYQATFNRTGGQLIGPWPGFESFSLSPAPVSTVWGVVRVANDGGILSYVDQMTFSRSEILSLLAMLTTTSPSVSLGIYALITDSIYSRPNDVGQIDADATAGAIVINLGIPGLFPVKVRKSPNDATFNTVTITYGAEILVLNITGQTVEFIPDGANWILWQQSF